jgi:hypothetical protein
MLTFAFRPMFLNIGWVESVENPLGIPAIAVLGDDVFSLAFVAYGVLMTATSLGLVRRYLRGDAVVRAQIRWFAAAIGTSLALFVMVFLTSDQPAGDLAWGRGSVAAPATDRDRRGDTRYRLYDRPDPEQCDRLRAGLVRARIDLLPCQPPAGQPALAAGRIRGPGSGRIDTLWQAFAPVRSRAQAWVDRRFHRAHYDAERMVSDLAARIRNEVDIARLQGDILDVVDRSVEPNGVTMWLKPGAGRCGAVIRWRSGCGPPR